MRSDINYILCYCRNPERKKGMLKNPLFRLLVVSVGFMTDAYDLFIFGIVIVIMGLLNPNDNTTIAKSVLGISIIVGTIIGQLLFGTFGDLFGRKRVFLITLSTIMVFALLSGFSFDINNTYYISLTMIRIVLGIGIGGEYPLSATIAAETSPSVKSRGCMMATVFSMQGIGNFMAPCVVVILLVIQLDLEVIWRLALAFGTVPGILILYWRYKLEETHTERIKTPQMLSDLRAHGWTLFGTCSTWFLFDIAFYGNGFFKETVVNILGFPGNGSNYEIVFNTTISSLIIAAIALPGYWSSIALIELVGRKPLQLVGFACESILFFIMGFLYNELQNIPVLFVILYGLTFFFSNLGPNTTTYVISAEAYPKHIRSTSHGLSSACGKLGALIGVAIFPSIVIPFGVQPVFIMCGVILLIGFIITLKWIPETKGLKLDEVEDEFELPETSTKEKLEPLVKH